MRHPIAAIAIALALSASTAALAIAAAPAAAITPAVTEAPATTLAPDAAARFAALALKCLHQEYPNHVSHTLNGAADARPPHELTPAFYGCLDWHSDVHGHWLLVRLLRLFPQAPFAATARAALEQVARLEGWLPKLQYPIRVGEHDQTAFAFGLIWDWAGVADDHEMRRLLGDAAQRFYRRDRNCPLAYEPSGEDFLSPCLAEADFMRRVLPPAAFASWLSEFLPHIPQTGALVPWVKGSHGWLEPAIVTDRSDPKLAHLDGLNLSRAWMLEGIAHGLPPGDKRLPALLAEAQRHADAALPAVTGEYYEGGHWLGTFAVYLTSRAGLEP